MVWVGWQRFGGEYGRWGWWRWEAAYPMLEDQVQGSIQGHQKVLSRSSQGETGVPCWLEEEAERLEQEHKLHDWHPNFSPRSFKTPISCHCPFTLERRLAY